MARLTVLWARLKALAGRRPQPAPVVTITIQAPFIQIGRVEP